MHKNKNLVLVLMLVTGLLLSFSTLSTLGSIVLGNGMGLHTVNIDDDSNVIVSNGYINVTNTESSDITISLSVSTKIATGDFDENGNPRKHKVSDTVFFDEIPDASWIELEETNLVIPANSIKIINYTLVLPKEEVLRSINYDTTNGYLVYIEVNPSSGSTIGINYRYKIFIVFEGEISWLTPFSYISLGLITLTISYFIISKVKHKRDLQYENTSETHNNYANTK